MNASDHARVLGALQYEAENDARAATASSEFVAARISCELAGVCFRLAQAYEAEAKKESEGECR